MFVRLFLCFFAQKMRKIPAHCAYGVRTIMVELQALAQNSKILTYTMPHFFLYRAIKSSGISLIHPHLGQTNCLPLKRVRGQRSGE